MQLLDHITDMIYFGAIKPCEVTECNCGKFIFDGNTSYRCTGMLSVFGDCNKRVKEPERRPVEIPPIYADFKFLNREFKPQHHRLFKDNPKAKSTSTKQPMMPKQVSTSNYNTRYRKMLMKGIL